MTVKASAINDCTFDSLPLVKVYEMICNLKMPYIWYTHNSVIEQLYLITDIETEAEVTAYSWRIDDIEFLEPAKDVIRLKLCRMYGKNIDYIFRSISCRSILPDKEITAENLLNQAGFRIPDISELESVNFVGDIPGNK